MHCLQHEMDGETRGKFLAWAAELQDVRRWDWGSVISKVSAGSERFMLKEMVITSVCGETRASLSEKVEKTGRNVRQLHQRSSPFEFDSASSETFPLVFGIWRK